MPAIVEHLEAVVGTVESPAILMGHSADGAFMQIVLDHGYGAVGVAINSAQTEGVPVAPLSQVKATFPVLKNPANHHRAVGTWVDYHNDSRAPLLFLSGSEDHLMPTAVQRSNAKHYKSNTITELKEYPGMAHLMPTNAGGLAGGRALRLGLGGRARADT